MISSWSTCHKILHILMFITSFGEQNITYKCCSNFLIHLCRKHTKKLNSLSINTVLDFVCASPLMIRDQFSVVMHRTILELQGISCIEIEQSPKAKKQIIASRSFGQKVYSCDDLKEAITLYVQDAV